MQYQRNQDRDQHADRCFGALTAVECASQPWCLCSHDCWRGTWTHRTARNAPASSVFMYVRCGPAMPCRSCVMPKRIFARSSMLWASVFTLILQPSAFALRRFRSFRSARAGAALCSTATPSSAHRLQYRVQVVDIGIATQHLAAGGMPEDAQVGVLDARAAGVRSSRPAASLKVPSERCR